MGPAVGEPAERRDVLPEVEERRQFGDALLPLNREGGRGRRQQPAGERPASHNGACRSQQLHQRRPAEDVQVARIGMIPAGFGERWHWQGGPVARDAPGGLVVDVGERAVPRHPILDADVPADKSRETDKAGKPERHQQLGGGRADPQRPDQEDRCRQEDDDARDGDDTVATGFLVPPGAGRGGTRPVVRRRDRVVPERLGWLWRPWITHSQPPMVLQSGGSQLFICLARGAPFDKQDTAFGRVTAGMELVDQIGQLQADEQKRLLAPVAIRTFTVTTAPSTSAGF